MFNGVWPKKKNWVAGELSFRNDWVFILDADEVMPPDSEQEIAGGDRGRRPRLHGLLDQSPLHVHGTLAAPRLLSKLESPSVPAPLGRYEELVQGATQSGDNEVHEHIIVQGRPADFAAKWIITPSRRSMCSSKNTIVIPTGRRRLELEEALDHTRSITPQSGHVRVRRKRKACRPANALPPAVALPLHLLFSGGISGWTRRLHLRASSCRL